jgi:hypothetical protein
MNTKDLIGRTIKDILVWSEIEVGGLDQAQVYIVLDNDKTIGIPWDFESENIEAIPDFHSESLFADLSDIPVYHVNPEGKSIQEIIDAKRKRDSSIWGRIKKAIGIEEQIPREYRPYKTTYRENKMKHLKDQMIIDFLMFDDFDSGGFLMLENGWIITETMVSPHGTGMAGLNYYESISAFEDSHGTEYKRLTDEQGNL